MPIVLLAQGVAAAPESSDAPEPTEQNQPSTDQSNEDQPEQVEEIVVHTETGSQIGLADSPVRVEVVGREAIRERGDTNLANSLGTRNGMSVQSAIGGTSAGIHGLEGRHILILIDGQRSTGRIAGVLDAERFSLEATEQVEVTKGPGSLLFGSDAVAGVINLVTRWPDEFTADLRGGYGRFGRINSQTYVGYGNEKFSSFVHGNFAHHKGWDLEPETVATTGDARLAFTAGGGVAVRNLKGFSANTQWSYRREELEGIDEAAGGAVFDRANRNEFIQGKVQPSMDWENGRSTVAFSWSHMRNQWMQDQRMDTALDQIEETLDHLATIDARHEHVLGTSHRIRAGYNVQLEWLRTPRIDIDGAERQRHGVYVQHEWIPTVQPRLHFLTGIRADWDRFFGFNLTPRLAMMIRPVEKLSLRVQFGRAYRAPDFKEMYMKFANLSVGYLVEGNPDLKPETSTSTLVSADWDPHHTLQLGTTIFNHRIGNLITTELDEEASEDSSSTIYTYVNRSQARSSGFEFRIHYEPGPVDQAWVSTTLNYTYQDTYDYEREATLSGRAKHTGQLFANFHPPRWGTRLAAELFFTGPRLIHGSRGGDSHEVPSSWMFNLRFRQSVWNKRLHLHARMTNIIGIGDAQYQRLEPRSWYVGLEMTL